MGMLTAATTGYLQIAVVAHASAFGPLATQAFMEGTNVSGVISSLGQYVIAIAIALGGSSREFSDREGVDGNRARDTETVSAIMFFIFSAAFMTALLVISQRIVDIRKGSSSAVLRRNVSTLRASDGLDEGAALLQQEEPALPDQADSKRPKANKLEVARFNLSYYFALAYLFIISGVRLSFRCLYLSRFHACLCFLGHSIFNSSIHSLRQL